MAKRICLFITIGMEDGSKMKIIVSCNLGQEWRSRYRGSKWALSEGYILTASLMCPTWKRYGHLNPQTSIFRKCSMSDNERYNIGGTTKLSW